MSAEAAAIALPERFTAGALPALKDLVDARRATGAPVTFDAAAVRAVDSAALQFLLVCHATGTAPGEAPILVGTGETLAGALADIGANEPLGR